MDRSPSSRVRVSELLARTLLIRGLPSSSSSSSSSSTPKEENAQPEQETEQEGNVKGNKKENEEEKGEEEKAKGRENEEQDAELKKLLGFYGTVVFLAFNRYSITYHKLIFYYLYFGVKIYVIYLLYNHSARALH